MKVVTFCVVLVFLVAPSTYSLVSAINIFPCEPTNRIAQLPAGRGNFVEVPLTRVFNFLSKPYHNLFINNNGGISFTKGVSEFSPICGPSSVPKIIPFWADVDTRNGGTVSYRETTDPEFLLQAGGDVRKAFPGRNNINLDWALVVTWDNVAFYGGNANCGGNTNRNTFQVILATDKLESFVIFLYSSLTWTTSTALNRNCGGLGGNAAKAGFNYGDGITFFDIGGSCTETILNISNATNTDEPGKWIFKVDTELQSNGCINRLQSEFEQLSINPSFVSIFGNVPISIEGPCMADAISVQVRFNDKKPITINASITNTNVATCIVPFLYTNGRIKVELLVTRTGGTVQTFWGYIYTMKHTSEIPFRVVNGSEFEMSWNSAHFDGVVSLDLELLELVGGRFSSRGVIKGNLSNTGHFKGQFDKQGVAVFEKLVNVYVVKLGVSPGILQKNIMVSINHPIISNLLNELGRRSPAEIVALCYSWYIQDTGAPTDALSCPPTLAQARVDDRFEPIEHLLPYNPDAEYGFMQRDPSPSGAGQRCVYRAGTLLVGPRSGGTVQSISPNGNAGEVPHITADLLPWVVCCYAAPDPNSCELYFERRPSNDGCNYEPPCPGSCIGDPHITTFDGLYYTFNGIGEFWFIKTQDNSFSMQGRTAQYVTPTGERTAASVCQTFVMQQRTCKGVVTIQLQLTRDAIQILIDGHVVLDPTRNPPTRSITHNGASILILSSKSVKVTFSSGYTFRFTYDVPNVVLNMIPMVDVKFRGKIRGLLGLYDGNRENDLTYPDGRVIPTNASPLAIHDFGMHWMINGRESLFTYPLGKTYESFRDIDFIPSFATPNLDTMPPEVVKACNGNPQCLFDFYVTGSLSLANNTRQGIEDVNNIIASSGVACQRPMTRQNGFLQALNFLVGSTVRLVCNRSFHEVEGFDTMTCVRNQRGETFWNRELGECINVCESKDPWEQFLCEISFPS